MYHHSSLFWKPHTPGGIIGVYKQRGLKVWQIRILAIKDCINIIILAVFTSFWRFTAHFNLPHCPYQVDRFLLLKILGYQDPQVYLTKPKSIFYLCYSSLVNSSIKLYSLFTFFYSISFCWSEKMSSPTNEEFLKL